MSEISKNVTTVIQSVVDWAKNLFSNLNTAVSTNTTNIATNSNAISALNGRVTTAETNISSNTSDIATNASNITTGIAEAKSYTDAAVANIDIAPEFKGVIEIVSSTTPTASDGEEGDLCLVYVENNTTETWLRKTDGAWVSADAPLPLADRKNGDQFVVELYLGDNSGGTLRWIADGGYWYMSHDAVRMPDGITIKLNNNGQLYADASTIVNPITGDLANLTTTAKGTLVGAINELKTTTDNIYDLIGDLAITLGDVNG
jgi:hypothetical protein